MPTVSCSTRAVASSDHNTLQLSATHYLTAGEPTARVFARKAALPDGVDVRAPSGVVLALRGSVDRERLSPSALCKSELVQYFHDFLNTHATQLGLAQVNDVCCDGQDGLPRLRLDVQGCPTAGETSSSLSLSLINVHFKWTTSSDSPGTEHSSPFAARLTLAHRALLEEAVRRFVTYHLVRRYPLIFGTWRDQMDVEVALSAKIYRSIASIIARSSNDEFRTGCSRLLRKLRRQRKAAAVSSAASLQEYMGTIYEPSDEVLDDEDPDLAALQFGMERLYRASIKRPGFKESHRARARRDSDADNEELTLAVHRPAKSAPGQVESGYAGVDLPQAHEDLQLAPADDDSLWAAGDQLSTSADLPSTSMDLLSTPMDDDSLWVGLDPEPRTVPPPAAMDMTFNEDSDGMDAVDFDGPWSPDCDGPWSPAAADLETHNAFRDDPAFRDDQAFEDDQAFHEQRRSSSDMSVYESDEISVYESADIPVYESSDISVYESDDSFSLDCLGDNPSSLDCADAATFRRYPGASRSDDHPHLLGYAASAGPDDASMNRHPPDLSLSPDSNSPSSSSRNYAGDALNPIDMDFCDNSLLDLFPPEYVQDDSPLHGDYLSLRDTPHGRVDAPAAEHAVAHASGHEDLHMDTDDDDADCHSPPAKSEPDAASDSYALDEDQVLEFWDPRSEYEDTSELACCADAKDDEDDEDWYLGEDTVYIPLAGLPLPSAAPVSLPRPLLPWNTSQSSSDIAQASLDTSQPSPDTSQASSSTSPCSYTAFSPPGPASVERRTSPGPRLATTTTPDPCSSSPDCYSSSTRLSSPSILGASPVSSSSESAGPAFLLPRSVSDERHTARVLARPEDGESSSLAVERPPRTNYSDEAMFLFEDDRDEDDILQDIDMDVPLGACNPSLDAGASRSRARAFSPDIHFPPQALDGRVSPRERRASSLEHSAPLEHCASPLGPCSPLFAAHSTSLAPGLSDTFPAMWHGCPTQSNMYFAESDACPTETDAYTLLSDARDVLDLDDDFDCSADPGLGGLGARPLGGLGSSRLGGLHGGADNELQDAGKLNRFALYLPETAAVCNVGETIAGLESGGQVAIYSDDVPALGLTQCHSGSDVEGTLGVAPKGVEPTQDLVEAASLLVAGVVSPQGGTADQTLGFGAAALVPPEGSLRTKKVSRTTGAQCATDSLQVKGAVHTSNTLRMDDDGLRFEIAALQPPCVQTRHPSYRRRTIFGAMMLTTTICGEWRTMHFSLTKTTPEWTGIWVYDRYLLNDCLTTRRTPQ